MPAEEQTLHYLSPSVIFFEYYKFSPVQVKNFKLCSHGVEYFLDPFVIVGII